VGTTMTAVATGKPAGSLTTVTPTEAGWAGLALVPRAVAVGDEVEVQGGAAARVER